MGDVLCVQSKIELTASDGIGAIKVDTDILRKQFEYTMLKHVKHMHWIILPIVLIM